MNSQPSIAQRLNSLRKDKSPASTAVRLPSIEDMLERERKLTQVQTEMLQEFAGLDAQIESIFKFLRPWWLLPQAQRRPVVISLWGMTGVGKSSFVMRLMEKLDLMEQFAQVDLSKMASGDAVALYSAVFPSSFNRRAGGPCVLFLDEIHRARTIDELGAEVDRPALSDYWTLIDSGMVVSPTDDWRHFMHQINRDIKLIYEMPEAATNLSSLDESALDYLGMALNLELDGAELAALANEDRLGFLEWMAVELKKVIRSSSPMDFRQALIFVAGNLDEAFVDAGAINPDDMNAEDLHKRTSSVSVDLIKECLLRRFRAEQVSRLGSMQVVFPSLSKASFEKLIAGRLKAIGDWAEQGFHTGLSFDSSVVQLVLQEGVVPSQGARPVISTITDLVECKLPTWLLEAARLNCKSLAVGFDKKTQNLEVADAGTGQVIFTEKLILREQRLPEIKMSEAVRHVIAVHEAGHAVVGIVREGRLPIKILAGALSWHRGGPRVVFAGIPVVTRELALQLLEVSLAGMVAEQTVFGKDHHSVGCSSDLQSATDRCAQMVTQLAMGDHIGVSMDDQNHAGNLSSLKGSDDEVVERWLRQAMQRAEAALQSQMPLFEALTQELMRADRLTVNDLKRLVTEHYRGPKKEIAAIFEREDPRALERLLPKRKMHLKRVA